MKYSNKKVLSLFVLITIVVILFNPFLTLAQVDNPPPGGINNPPAQSIEFKVPNPFKCPDKDDCTVTALIRVIINDILIPIGGVVAALMIMWAGFLYVTARGDSSQIKRAHEALTWAVIGAAILLGARVISGAIEATIKQLQSGS